MVFLINELEIYSVSSDSRLLLCIAPLTLAVMVMRGLTFQPWALIASISGLYLSSFICMACSMNLSCVKVNSMIWMVMYGVGIGGFCRLLDWLHTSDPRMFMFPLPYGGMNDPFVQMFYNESYFGGKVL